MKVKKQGEMYTVELHENDLNTMIELFNMLNITTCSQINELVDQIRQSRKTEADKLYLISDNTRLLARAGN